MTSLLFLGASGQVGGAFLPVFRKQYPTIPITVFLRSKELDSALEALGSVSIVHGTFSDLDTIESLAASHSIIINCASSLEPSITAALIRGAIARKASTSTKSILYHLSGAGNFVDNSQTGNFIPTEHRFDDADPEDVKTISAASLPNGPCDELIFAAATAGDLNALFVCPAGIYGNSASHIGIAAGAASALAPGVWVNYMLSNVEALGFAPYVGEGTSVFGTVHVDDVVALMMLVFQKALDTYESYKPQDVYSHFYIGVVEEHAAKDLAAAFADVMFRRGKIAAPVSKSVAYEDAGFVARYIAGNMLVTCENSKSLGWKPQGPGLIETLKHTE